jgi:hypothetical protein
VLLRLRTELSAWIREIHQSVFQFTYRSAEAGEPNCAAGVVNVWRSRQYHVHFPCDLYQETKEPKGGVLDEWKRFERKRLWSNLSVFLWSDCGKNIKNLSHLIRYHGRDSNWHLPSRNTDHYNHINYLGKGKAVPLLNELSNTLWRHRGEWRYSSTILDLGTRWNWVVSFKPLPLYPRGNRPIGYEAGWALDPLWTLWRKFLSLSGIEPEASRP